jgi:hypothetical protein
VLRSWPSRSPARKLILERDVVGQWDAFAEDGAAALMLQLDVVVATARNS